MTEPKTQTLSLPFAIRFCLCVAVTLFAGLVLVQPALALGERPIVSFEPTPGAFAIAEGGVVAPIAVDGTDFPGVQRAARDLQADVRRVTGATPELRPAGPLQGRGVIIVGTVGRSGLIDQLVRAGKLDTRSLVGKWEASLIEVVKEPLPGVDQALVVAGSDKRGTIFGIYTLSEQIGVSPWYWWADVPVRRRQQVYVAPTRLESGEPAVKYRGIFLNDEAPSLTNWTQEKFGGFNHSFYTHVFELILRLKGNYLWPAMWGSAFSDDDAQNPALADEYGVVMGTSHHEPLMRAHAEWARYGEGPWNYAANEAVLQKFWRGGVQRVRDFEKIVTIGMRGDGDEAMSEETNVALLEKIVRDQRAILKEVTGKPPEETPQLWALYKEVQGYYERGMRVPEDVTLLWCDDNWGNIRRLPTAAERNRPGGAGVYYHFDYVGGPRNYKWLNTVPITKVWEQMHLATEYGANRIWIVNVGDLKPMEFPIEFFLNLAWNPKRWPYEKLSEYSESWAAREFGAEHAREVAALINGYTKLNGRRKPELLSPETLSLTNEREAERVLAEWKDLAERARRQFARLPAEARDAYYQLVLYPVQASANAQELYAAAGLNRWYVQQGRASASAEAAKARELFARDAAFVKEYHALGGGKWNHMMDQVKFGYTYWQQPDIEAMPAVSEVTPRSLPSLGVAIEGSKIAWPSYGAKPAVLPSLDYHGASSRWIEVFNRGSEPFDFSAKSESPWLQIAPASGTVTDQRRLELTVDWSRVPEGESKAMIEVVGPGKDRVRVELPLRKNPQKIPTGFRGYIEADRQVAIEAPRFSRKVDHDGIGWRILPGFGRTLGGVTISPVTAPEQKPGGASPRLEYDVLFASAGEVSLEFHCAPSIDFQPGQNLRFAVSIDEQEPVVVKLDTWTTMQNWEQGVSDGVRRVTASGRVVAPGVHTVKVWMITPAVVVERIIIDAGGVRPSYLGPIESKQVGLE